MAPASITDLPTELLIEIFEYPTFPSEALYSSALLCRRLYFIALPLYFSRNGVDLEAKSAVINLRSDGRDPLSALQICLFVSSMKQISCIFPHTSCTTIDPLVAQLKRLRAFIARLSSVETVALNFDPGVYHHARCLSAGSDKVLKEWAHQYGDLLGCIVKAGCNSLTVIKGSQLTEAYQIGQVQLRERYLPSAIRRLLPAYGSRAFGFERRSVQGTKDIRLSALPSPRVSNLTSLHILSATLVVPPGLDWTLSVLRHCPITTLTICMSRISGDPRVWRRVLPLVRAAAPNLTTVSLLEVYNWDQQAAISFVAQLPHLTDLTLDFGSPHMYHWPVSALKSLVNLRAPPAVVEDLFSLHPRALPSIQSIGLVWNPCTDPNPSALVNPMAAIADGLGMRELSPRISLSLPSTRIAPVLEKVAASAQKDCFQRIQSLHITDRVHDLSAEFRKQIVSFIGLLPSVGHVELTTAAEDVPTAEVLSLVRGVRATESLKVIEVNGLQYALSDVRGSEG
ncbi:hypothetical protein C8R45DRAFT_1010423 [Mycena sanguinolenta]|nr:hypothetical protein C8R45DRAFT_1010423 [Mycena sanguinolenta]